MAKLTVVRIKPLTEHSAEASPPEGSHVVSLNSLAGRPEDQPASAWRKDNVQNHYEAAIVNDAVPIVGHYHRAI